MKLNFSGPASILPDVRGECRAQDRGNRQSQAFGQRTDVLDSAAYNKTPASELYANIKTRAPNQPQFLPAAQPAGNVEIFVGPMKWQTLAATHRWWLCAVARHRAPCSRGSDFSKGIASFIKTARLPAKFAAAATLIPGSRQHQR